MCYHQGASFGRGHHHAARFSGPQHGFGRWARHFAPFAGTPPVNLVEKKDWYELHIYAPGLTKDAFQVAVSDEVLSVKFQPGAPTTDTANWLHREYERQAFERQFHLNGKVDTAGITARYVDGVLELTLPKNANSVGQEIAVS